MSDEPVRILVVDDELGMREGCRKILTAEGYEVETAEDGLDGLARFKAGPNFAAALIDLKMPRMDGIELIEKIHAQDEDILLLIITAYATIETAVEATKRGAYGYIPKPFTPDELLLPVRNGLERRALAMEAKRLREEREKRLLEVAFERSKSKTILHCMTDGVLVINRDKQIVLRNAAAARVVGESGSLSSPVPLHALGREELVSLVMEALDASSDMIASKEIAFGNSTYMVNASPVVEPNGEVLGVVAVLRDITVMKKLEEAKSMFVSMVAHEIKSPLAAVEGYLNVLLGGMAGDLTEKARGMLDRSLLRTKALRTMVSDLLNVTAIETGHFSIKRMPICIEDIVAEVVDSYRERAREKKLDLQLNCDGPLDPVLADRDAMVHVIGNLIDNAVKYTPEGGQIRVDVGHNGMYARISVQDDGIGMSEEEKGRVFEEFYRAKNQYTASIPGTGLGLNLVKRLVDLHQGRITVESKPGEGSKFTVSLPMPESQVGEAEPRNDT